MFVKTILLNSLKKQRNATLMPILNQIEPLITFLKVGHKIYFGVWDSSCINRFSSLLRKGSTSKYGGMDMLKLLITCMISV